MPHVSTSSRPTSSPSAPRRASLSVRAKIATLVATFAVVAIALGGVAATQIRGVTADSARLAQTQATVGTSLTALKDSLWTVRNTITAIAAYPRAGQQAQVDKLTTAYTNLQTSETAFVTAYKASQGAEPAHWKEFVDALAAYRTMVDGDLMFAALSGDQARWAQIRDNGAAALGGQMVQALTSVEGEVTAAMASQAQASQQAGDRAIVVTFAVLAGGLVIATVLGLRLAGTIRRAVAEVKRTVDAMADGDLTQVPQVFSGDEIGKMSAALAVAQSRIRETLRGVGDAISTVASASEEMSAVSSQVAASSEETSAQAGVVAAAAGEVSRNVAAVAAGAEQMGASIREIAQNANEAAKVAHRATGVAASTNESVARLGTSSAEIGDVVKVITQIAEQTNLLALNATIEAARAGAAGKGFAVVAGEVKELAQETAKATGDISRRVEAIQSDTTGAVRAIGEISAIIASINDYQLSIASAVEQQTATTNEMSRGVTEAAAGSGEIATNITGVAAAAHGSTEALSQLNDSTRELSHLSASLQTQIGRFTY